MNAATVAVILRVELMAWRNRLVKSRSNRTALVGFSLAVGGFVIGGTVFALADGASQFLPYARDPMLVGAFTLLSILMLVVGFPTVITNFFVGPDLIQLIVAPVRPVEIFLARSVLAMRANVLLGFVIATFVIGVGAGANAGPAYYAMAFVLVALQVLLVTAVQTVMLCVILRWVPARLARDVSVIVASLSGAGIYLLWQLTLRQTIGREPDVSGLLSFARRIDWLPAAWPGHALSAVLAGSLVSSVAWLGITLVLAALLVAIAGALYGRTLIAGFGELGGAAPRWKPRTVAVRRASGAPRRISPELAIAAKDWLTYRRDVRRLSRLLPALIFLAGYALVLNRPQRGIASFWNDAFIVAFVSMFMSMAVATSAVPSERRGFQLLRMAPVKMSQLLVAKIAYTMSPLVAVSAAISIAIAVGGHNAPGDVVELAVLALWLGFGFVAIAVSVGAIDPRFDAADDRRMVGAGGTLAAFAAELGFGLLSMLALVAVHVYLHASGAQTAVPGVALVVGAVVLAMGAAGVVLLLLRTANSRLNAFEEAIQSA